MNLLDWLTLVSYVALNIDMLFQIKRIHRTRSSKDLSLPGMTIRYVAILIILIKFASLADLSLILGQTLVALTFTVYLALAVSYSHNRKKR